jgi:hypothetical protein
MAEQDPGRLEDLEHRLGPFVARLSHCARRAMCPL